MIHSVAAQAGQGGRATQDAAPGAWSVFRSTLYRNTGVFGKDLVRYFPVPLLIAGVALIVVGAPRLIDLLYPHRMGTQLLQLGANLLYIFLPITAYSVGLAVGGDEEDAKTRLFLDQLPGRRNHYVLGKLAAGIALVLLWILLYVFVVGPITGYGFSLWRKFTETLYSGPAFWARYMASFYWWASIALFFTGAAAGALFRSVVIAAFGGAGMLIACLLLLLPLFHGRSDPFSHSREEAVWFLPAVAGIWCLAMTVTMRLRYGHAREDVERSEIRDATEAALEEIRPVPHRGFDAPWSYAMRYPLFLVCAFCLAGPWLAGAVFGGDSVMFWVPAVVVAGALLGVISWIPEERDGTRFFLYALPVTRSTIYWTRIGSLVGRTVLIIIAVALGLTLAAAHNIDMTPERSMLRFFGLVLPLTALSCALCGNLFALFHRLRVAAVFLALVVGCTWGLVAEIALRYSGRIPGIGANDFVIYSAWIGLVMLALPLVTGYIAFCRSPLLEQSEERRGSIAVPVLLLLLIWGAFLIGMSPAQLAMIFWG